MKHPFARAALALLSIAAAGCAGGSSSPSGPAAPIRGLQLSDSLQGSWVNKGGCVADPTHPDDLISGKGTITFSGQSVVSVLDVFADRNCQTPQSHEEFYGTYSVSDDPKISEPGARAIDFSLTKEVFVILSQDFINQCRAGNCVSCVADMQLNVAKTFFPPDHCMKEDWIGQSPYRAFKVSRGELTISDDGHSGEEPDYRMTGFEQPVTFVRQ
jgi:hypothetical protein